MTALGAITLFAITRLEYLTAPTSWRRNFSLGESFIRLDGTHVRKIEGDPCPLSMQSILHHSCPVLT